MQASTTVIALSSRRHMLIGLAAAATLSALPQWAPGAVVTMTATDTLNNSSFLLGTRWSDGQAPNAANDYVVPGGLTLRTPGDSGTLTFGGNSLTLGDNGSAVGQLLFKNLTNNTVTVNNLTLNKGLIANGGTVAAAATAITLASNGNITLGPGGGTFDAGAAARTITVANALVGDGPVTVINAGNVVFAATNAYTNTTTITGGALVAAEGVGLPTASPLVLSGGSIAGSGAFTRGLGTGAGQVAISGAGGFSATGGDLAVAIGGTAAPTALTVGMNGFAPALMTLNYNTATHAIDFRNNVDLAGTTTFGVNTNTTTVATGATFSGVISDSIGGGAFTKANTGLLTLTATNTYAGRTNVNGGFLRGTDGVNIPTASNITFGGGVLAPIGSTFTRSLGTGPGQVQFTAAATGGFTALDQDLTVAFGGTASPTPLVWGTTEGFSPNAVILGGRLGTNTVTLTNAIDLSTPTTNTFRILASHGGTAVVTGVISNTGAAGGVLAIEGDAAVGSGVIVLDAANTYGGTTQIDTGGQGAAVVRATNNLSFGTSLIQFNPPGGVSTGRLELTNNITLANNVWFSGRNNTTVAIDNVSGDNTLAGTLSIQTGGGSYIIQSTSGTLTLTGASGSTLGTAVTGVATGVRTLTLQGASNGVVSGVIANGASTVALTKAGSGTWTLTGTNTFTGAINVNAGTLQLGNGTAGNDGTVANSSGITVAAGATLAFNRAGNSTAAYVISGSGTLTKSGAGTQTLTGANTYAGTTTVSNGTLEVTPAAAAVLLAGTGTTGGTDIRNGSVVFTGGNVAAIRGLLAGSFQDAVTPGVMDSGTLRSSTATITRGLGYEDTGTGVVVKAALFGDADLDGGVSINDFNALAGNFGQASGKAWVDGDFDYDGGVSINDFNLLAGGFGQSLPASSEMWAGLLAFAAAHNDLAAFEAVTGVPEPTAFATIGLAGAVGLRRRRRCM